MRVVLTKEDEFRGWDAIRDTCMELGPKRLLVALVQSASRSMYSGDFRFFGGSHHNSITHGLLARTLLLCMVDGGDIEGIPDLGPFTKDEMARIARVFEQLNGLVGSTTKEFTYVRRNPRTTTHLKSIAEISCRLSIAQRQAPKRFAFELARARIMLEELWPAVRREKAKAALELEAEPMSSAFDSLGVRVRRNPLLLSQPSRC